MLLEDMIPRRVIYLDEMALGVANLSDDIVLDDRPRLSTTWDEILREDAT
jgi:hypothetical protein